MAEIVTTDVNYAQLLRQEPETTSYTSELPYGEQHYRNLLAESTIDLIEDPIVEDKIEIVQSPAASLREISLGIRADLNPILAPIAQDLDAEHNKIMGEKQNGSTSARVDAEVVAAILPSGPLEDELRAGWNRQPTPGEKSPMLDPFLDAGTQIIKNEMVQARKGSDEGNGVRKAVNTVTAMMHAIGNMYGYKKEASEGQENTEQEQGENIPEVSAVLNYHKISTHMGPGLNKYVQEVFNPEGLRVLQETGYFDKRTASRLEEQMNALQISGKQQPEQRGKTDNTSLMQILAKTNAFADLCVQMDNTTRGNLYMSAQAMKEDVLAHRNSHKYEISPEDLKKIDHSLQTLDTVITNLKKIAEHIVDQGNTPIAIPQTSIDRRQSVAQDFQDNRGEIGEVATPVLKANIINPIVESPWKVDGGNSTNITLPPEATGVIDNVQPEVAVNGMMSAMVHEARADMIATGTAITGSESLGLFQAFENVAKSMGIPISINHGQIDPNGTFDSISVLDTIKDALRKTNLKPEDTLRIIAQTKTLYDLTKLTPASSDQLSQAWPLSKKSLATVRRFLTLAQAKGDVDSPGDKQIQAELAQYRSEGAPFVHASAETVIQKFEERGLVVSDSSKPVIEMLWSFCDNTEDLKDMQRLSILLGDSGVGKSTLVKITLDIIQEIQQVKRPNLKIYFSEQNTGTLVTDPFKGLVIDTVLGRAIEEAAKKEGVPIEKIIEKIESNDGILVLFADELTRALSGGNLQSADGKSPSTESSIDRDLQAMIPRVASDVMTLTTAGTTSKVNAIVTQEGKQVRCEVDPKHIVVIGAGTAAEKRDKLQRAARIEQTKEQAIAETNQRMNKVIKGEKIEKEGLPKNVTSETFRNAFSLPEEMATRIGGIHVIQTYTLPEVSHIIQTKIPIAERTKRNIESILSNRDQALGGTLITPPNEKEIVNNLVNQYGNAIEGSQLRSIDQLNTHIRALVNSMLSEDRLNRYIANNRDGSIQLKENFYEELFKNAFS